MSSILIRKGETIIDVEKFIKSHTIMIESNPDAAFIEPYKDRLEKLKKIIK